jgi:hypothetical protein
MTVSLVMVSLVTVSLMAVSLWQVATLALPYSVIARRPQADVAIHCSATADGDQSNANQQSIDCAGLALRCNKECRYP